MSFKFDYCFGKITLFVEDYNNKEHSTLKEIEGGFFFPYTRYCCKSCVVI